MKVFRIYAFFSLCFAESLFAHSLFDSNQSFQKNERSHFILAFSDISYDVKASADDFYIDSTIIGADYQSSIDPTLNFSAQAGLLLDSYLDSCSGDGYLIGTGLSRKIYQEKGELAYMALHVNHQSSNYECNDGAKLDLNISDFSVMTGISGNFTPSIRWLFAGILNLKTIGNGKNKTNGGKFKFDRDKPIGVSFAAASKLETLTIKAELRFFSESSLMISVGKAI